MYARLGWFLSGLALAVGLCLMSAGAQGGFGALVMGGLALFHLGWQQVPGRIGAAFGFLCGIDAFVLALWISPPCDFADLANTSLKPLPGGGAEFVCEPQDLTLLAVGALAGTVVISGLILFLQRRASERSDAPHTKLSPIGLFALTSAVAAVFASSIGAVAVMSQSDWTPSALVRMAESDPIAGYARSHDPSFALFHPEAHYDGVYFYAIGADPLALGPAHKLLDLGAHRYTHPLYGWMAWLLSAGQPKFVPHALLLISLMSMGVAGAGFAFLAARFGMSPLAGLWVTLNPGLIASVTFDTAEPLGAAILVLALLAWTSERRALGAAGFLLLSMTRQPFALIPLGVAAWEIARNRRSMSFRPLLMRVAPLALGPLAMVLWQVYLFFRFEELPFATGEVVLTLPFQGWLEAFGIAARLGGGALAQVGLPSLALLIVAFAAALLVAYRALTTRTFMGAIYLALMIIFFSLEELAIVFPKELLRYAAIPLLIAPLVFMHDVPGDRSTAKTT